MASYTYPKAAEMQANLHGVERDLTQAGIPVAYIVGNPSAGELTVWTTRLLTTEEEETQANIVAAYDGRARQLRPLLDIYQDLGALTGAQMTATWSDLMSGTPHKLATDTGPNAASILVLDWVANWTTTITAADR